MVLEIERSREIFGLVFRGGDVNSDPKDERIRQYRLDPSIPAEPIFPVELLDRPEELLGYIPRFPLVPAEDGVGYTVPINYSYAEMQDVEDAGILVFEKAPGLYELCLILMPGQKLPTSFADGYKQGEIRGFLYDRNQPDRLNRLKGISSDVKGSEIFIHDDDLEVMVGFAESFVCKAYERTDRYRRFQELG